jgi:hypothetical protein
MKIAGAVEVLAMTAKGVLFHIEVHAALGDFAVKIKNFAPFAPLRLKKNYSP